MQRELREECGLVAKCWKEILGMDLSNSVSDESGTLFLAWDLDAAPGQPDDTEQLQIARIPFWDAVARVKRGEIRDAMSVAAGAASSTDGNSGELPEEIAKLIRA